MVDIGSWLKICGVYVDDMTKYMRTELDNFKIVTSSFKWVVSYGYKEN